MKRITATLLLLTFFSQTIFAAPPLGVIPSGRTISAMTPLVTFELPNPGQEAATTNVYTLRGERIAELTAQSLGRFVWDGKDFDQQPVASGLYVVQIYHHGSVFHGPVLVNHSPQ